MNEIKLHPAMCIHLPTLTKRLENRSDLRGYKVSLWDADNVLFCVLGSGYTRTRYVIVHWDVHISGVQFYVCMLYTFNFIHKKMKDEDSHFQPRQNNKNDIYLPISNNNKNKQNIETKVLKILHIRKWRSVIDQMTWCMQKKKKNFS